MKYILQITSLLVCAASVCLTASAEENPVSGRIQYSGLPGGGAGSMKFLDQKLPQTTIRVGPSGQAGVGLAFLIGIEVTPEKRNALMMAEKVELQLNVVGVDQYNGAPPSPLQVAFLQAGSSKNPEFYGHFGAWNKANNLVELGVIEADPEPGVYTFDITEALNAAPVTTDSQPMIFFGVYAPVEDLMAANAGQHVLISGEGETAPRLKISE